MRLIDADRFLESMAFLYIQSGWKPNEVHFSFNDLDSNLSMEPTVPAMVIVPKKEVTDEQISIDILDSGMSELHGSRTGV